MLHLSLRSKLCNGGLHLERWVIDYELLENSRLWIDCKGRKMIINLKDGIVE